MPTRVMNKGGTEGVDEIFSGDQMFLVGKNVVIKDVREEKEKDVREEKEKGFVKNSCFKNITCSDESSSSIGKNSDISENSMEKSGDGEEVQSSYKGPLDAMEALEEVLPMRRGISSFYNGKSKSFASLADASSTSSVKDLAKPENAYMKRRRNLLACNLNWDKSRNNGGGISKRVTSSSRTALALAVAMNNSKGVGECNAGRSLPVSCLKKDFTSWRSFSLADLQQFVSVANSNSNQLNESRP